IEAREVVLEAARVVDPHVVAKRLGVVARHRFVILSPEVEQRFWTHRAVEMTVQLGFGHAAQQLRVDDRHPTPRRQPRDRAWRSIGEWSPRSSVRCCRSAGPGYP